MKIPMIKRKQKMILEKALVHRIAEIDRNIAKNKTITERGLRTMQREMLEEEKLELQKIRNILLAQLSVGVEIEQF